MCGIAGFVGPGGSGAVQAMMQRLRHRGPDGEGFYEEAERQVLLGHTRLAILDLEHGRQPMWDEERSVGVVFNGEIYNHAELRADLEARGHRFVTDHSDTEVLVQGYRRWGQDLWQRLNGMFALCLFDRAAGILVLVRDRMGEKPLYYIHEHGLFAFASEPNALFAHPHISRDPDDHGLQKFFAYGYSPGATTVFKGVHKLRPGEILVYDLGSARIKRERFFTFRIDPNVELARRSDANMAEELCELIDRAVALRLVADVPVGLLLSGGIDSSTILASACHQRQPQTIDAFTIGFKEPSFDESPYAKLAGQRAGCRHHVRTVTIDDARALVASIFQHLGEPFGDPSILPTSILTGFAREKIKVALSGDGGDELFAGYDPFLALKHARIYEMCMSMRLHELARSIANRLPVSDANMSFDFKIRRALLGMSYPKAIRLPVWMSALEPRDLVHFFDSPLPIEELYSEALEVWNDNLTGSDIDRALEFFTRIYLPDDILLKTDRASMMHGLEVRAVFLDNNIVDFMRRLPHRYKLRHGNRKWLLKKAVANRVPRELINRRKKGFGIPLSAWLRDMPTPLHHLNAIMNNGEVLERWRKHRERQADERFLLWGWWGLQEAMSPTTNLLGSQGKQSQLATA